MAKPIKETPILKGKDAVDFLKDIENPENKKITAEVAVRIKENFDKLQAIAKF